MSFKKKMDRVPTGYPVFYTAKINNPQTKKPYLIKGQHFRVFEKNSGFRVQVLNWVMNVPCGTWLLQSKCRELHR
jgi:hypothetical protein